MHFCNMQIAFYIPLQKNKRNGIKCYCNFPYLKLYIILLKRRFNNISGGYV